MGYFLIDSILLQHGAAAVTDAERLYEVSKDKAAEWTEKSKDAISGAAQRVTMAAGHALRTSGEKLVSVGSPPTTGPSAAGDGQQGPAPKEGAGGGNAEEQQPRQEK